MGISDEAEAALLQRLRDRVEFEAEDNAGILGGMDMDDVIDRIWQHDWPELKGFGYGIDGILEEAAAHVSKVIPAAVEHLKEKQQEDED